MVPAGWSAIGKLSFCKPVVGQARGIQSARQPKCRLFLIPHSRYLTDEDRASELLLHALSYSACTKTGRRTAPIGGEYRWRFEE